MVRQIALDDRPKLETEEGEEVPIIDLFYVEDEPCRDLKSSEECSALEPTCGVFADLGYRYCRKTCGFCDSKIQRSKAWNTKLEEYIMWVWLDWMVPLKCGLK